MKTETKYICDYCGKKYLTEEECHTCEESHGIAQTIETARYSEGSKYPDTICVGFNNDHHIIYKYLKPLVNK